MFVVCIKAVGQMYSFHLQCCIWADVRLPLTVLYIYYTEIHHNYVYCTLHIGLCGQLDTGLAQVSHPQYITPVTYTFELAVIN